MWDPFRSEDPEIRFLIATIVTAAIVMTDINDMQTPLRTIITAAARLREIVDERQTPLG